MSGLRPPRVVADGDAYLWTVEADGVPHQIAWCLTDGGSLRLSFPTSESQWSPFVKMGAAFSPQRTVAEAADAIRRWLDSRLAVPDLT